MMIPDCPLDYLIETNLYTDHFRGANYYDYKLGKDVKYNEKNNVIALGVRCNDFTLGFTAFENSFYKESYMISLEYNAYSINDVHLDLGIGLVKGYDKYYYEKLFINDKIMVSPLVSINYKPEYLKFDDFDLTPKLRFLGTAIAINLEVSF